MEDALHSGARLPVMRQYAWLLDAQRDGFSRQLVEKPEYSMLAHKLDSSIKALAAYRTACEKLQSDEVWGRHINKLVGTLMWRHRLGPDDVLMGIPLYSLNETAQFDLARQRFDEEIEKLEEFFQSPTVEIVKTTPLYGITLQNRISLTDRISIEPITRARALELLNDGVDPPRMFSSAYTEDFVDDFPPTAIVTRFPLTKMVHDPDEPLENLDSLRDQLNRSDIDEETIVDLLILIADTTIKPLGSLTKAVGYMDAARSTKKYEIRNPWAIPTKAFGEEAVEKLQELWPIFDGSNRRPWHFLVIAVRRFSLAMTRSSLDDKIIDLMICAEAIFLGREEKSELSHRLAHRAALLLGEDANKQKEIFGFFKAAYNMRSNVVHGTKSYIRESRDAESLSDTATKLAEHLRNAVLRMLALALIPHAPKELINWTELMFPIKPEVEQQQKSESP